MECEKRTIGNITLTDEANNLISAIEAGESVKGYAYAGTGKSTLLRAVEKYMPHKKGLYICYNKTLEKDARKLFKGHNVDISTSHAFALNSFPFETRNEFTSKTKRKPNFESVIKFAGITPSEAEFDVLKLKINWKLLVDVVDLFNSTASLSLTGIHVKDVVSELLNKVSKEQRKINKDRLVDYLVEKCKRLAKESLNPKSDCPSTHDGYLKSWQLSNPKLDDYDYIMFDEAQDANPVTLNVILKQSCQQIFVGDKHQSIYQFRGGVNAMDIIPHEGYPLSCSFRYGQNVADLATKVLRKVNDSIRITGKGFDTQVINGSSFTEFDAPLLYIAKTNRHLFDALVVCYENNRPASFVGGDKAADTLLVLESIVTLKSGELSTYKPHRKFSSYEDLRKRCDMATKWLVTMVDEEPDKASAMLDALHWQAGLSDVQPVVQLVTAHSSKGLEADSVMIGDDFQGVVKSFTEGKKIKEADLNLFYVAITRPRKLLVLPDTLYDALYRTDDLAFTVEPYRAKKALLDNLKSEPKGKSKKQADEKPTKQTPANKPQESSSSNESELPKSNVGINVEVGQSNVQGGVVANYWCPTDTSKFRNPNIAVLGTMGTGKTQAVKSIVYQIKQQEKNNIEQEKLGILIFDYKKDYCGDKAFLNATGAKVLDPNVGPMPINPFALYSKSRHAVNNTAKQFVSTAAKLFNLGVCQQNMLQDCIKKAYENRNIYNGDVDSYKNFAPTLKHVADVFFNLEKPPQNSLTKALSDFNDYGLFEENPRKCKPLFESLDGEVLIVNLSGELDEGLVMLIVDVLLHSFYAQMSTLGKPNAVGSHRALKKLILVDEADNFMSEDFPSLRKILKEGREFGVGCMLSTQGLDHFKTKNNDYTQYMNAWLIHQLVKPKVSDLAAVTGFKKGSDEIEEVSELGIHQSFFFPNGKNPTRQESTAFYKLKK